MVQEFSMRSPAVWRKVSFAIDQGVLCKLEMLLIGWKHCILLRRDGDGLGGEIGRILCLLTRIQ